jgi:hypothetical protein
MLKILLSIVVVLAAGVCIEKTAEAQSGGWCAYYNFGGHDGYRRCGFTSLEQCVWDVRGVGGSCGPSPYDERPHHHLYRRGYPPH